MSRTHHQAGTLLAARISPVSTHFPPSVAVGMRAQLDAIRDVQLTLNLLASHVNPDTSATGAVALELAQVAAVLRILNQALAGRIAAAESVLLD